MSTFEFQKAREQLVESAQKCLQQDDLAELETCFNNLSGSDPEKKQVVDQALRDVLTVFIERDSETELYLSVINLAGSAVQHELCSTGTLFLLLQDVFDSIALEKCNEVFKYLEDRVNMWKSEVYYAAGKNYLLRMCNDLLRRLSKSQNTVFCGRIQLFLARLFPLSERSGLNIMSQFNIENVTVYNTKPEEYDKARKQSIEEKDDSMMDFEEGEMDDRASNIPIDYNLYKKFWSLQDYFRKPTQCFEKTSWKTFSGYSDEVLGCFESFKLDDVKSSRKRKDSIHEAIPDDSGHTFFSKFLTSEKLLDLQVSDGNFRRYVLVQMLIMFQYLNGQVKFKTASQVLTEEQSAWVKQTTDRVYQVLKETPPDGDKFCKAIEHILSREENWNSWKNNGCERYDRDKPADEKARPITRGKKRSIGDDIKASGSKLTKMGNAELTRLWNLCPDNMAACRSDQRDFLPGLEDYFNEAIEQCDPEAMIEDSYKLVNNPNFAWKALRLLSRQSPHFFAQAQQQQKQTSVPQYLEMMIGKIAKELPSAQPEGAKHNGAEPDGDTEEDVVQETNGAEENLADNKGDEEEEEGSSPSVDETALLLTKEQIELLSVKLFDDWKKLATEMNFPEDDVAYFESETDDKTAQAAKMLIIWKENEGDKATVEVLRNALKEIGQVGIANDVFGESSEAT